MAQKYPKIAQNGPKMTQNCPNGDISPVSPTFCISAGKHPMGQVSSIITIAKYHPSYKKKAFQEEAFCVPTLLFPGNSHLLEQDQGDCQRNAEEGAKHPVPFLKCSTIPIPCMDT